MARKKPSKKRKKASGRRGRGPARRAPILDPEINPANLLGPLAELFGTMPPGALAGLMEELAEAGASGLDPFDVIDELIDTEVGENDVPPLVPAFPENCSPPIRLRLGGGTTQDPWATLGLERGADEQQVRAAYRRALEATPPEEDREQAARLNDARSLLLDPERICERLLGEVHVPDPDAWGVRRGGEMEPTGAMPAPARMAAQLLLYAVVEEELLEGPVPARPRPPWRDPRPESEQRGLFD